MAKKKILIIEDEIELADMLKLRLEVNDYDVIAAYDGQAALESLKTDVPDLIILDLMLPGIDGYSLYDIFRKHKDYSKIPIVIFTAKAQEEDIVFWRRVGADAYIVKPFDPQALIAKIKELLERK